MKLSEILKEIEEIEVLNFFEREIKDVSENSKEANEFSIFAVLQGSKFDGADFLYQAKKAGCRVFLSERKIDIVYGETLILSKNARKTMAELSKKVYFSKIKDMIIFGITGTKGKTTTAKILIECLNSKKLPSVMIGTLGVEYAGLNKPSKNTNNTTPTAPFIYKTLADAYNSGAKAAVIEVSSQALISYRVYGIPFTVCVFTNLSPDHIGRYEHSSFEEYRDAKLSLFKNYGAKVAVINIDSKYSDQFVKESENCRAKLVTVSKKSKSNFQFKIISSSLNFSEFNLCSQNFVLNMGGEYNIMNAAVAIAAAKSVTDGDISSFKNALLNISVLGRYEVYEKNGVKIIIDFAHNAESFKEICRSVRKITKGKIRIVFGSVGGRSKMRRSALAKTAEKYADIS